MMYVELIAAAVLAYFVLVGILLTVGRMLYLKYSVTYSYPEHECCICKKKYVGERSEAMAEECAYADVTYNPADSDAWNAYVARCEEFEARVGT